MMKLSTEVTVTCSDCGDDIVLEVGTSASTGRLRFRLSESCDCGMDDERWAEVVRDAKRELA